MTCRCAACLRTPLRVVAASSAVGGLPRHLRMRTKIRLLATSRRGSICLGRRLNPPQHAPPQTRSPLSVYRPGGIPHATRVWHRLRPLHIARFYLLSKCVMQRMRVWSLPALLFLSEPVCRSVGRRPEARAHGGKATRPHPPRHPSRRISLGSRRSSARCARTAPDSPCRVVSACDDPTN